MAVSAPDLLAALEPEADGAELITARPHPPRFRVFALDDPVYSRYICDPEGRWLEPLSFGLSAMRGDLANSSARDYTTALRSVLDAWASEHPRRVDALFRSTDDARDAIKAMLQANGCKVTRSRRPDRSFIVTLRAPQGGEAEHGHQRIICALLALQHVFDALHDDKRWPKQNPLKVDDHEWMRQLMASLPPPPGTSGMNGYTGSLFRVAGRPSRYRPVDTTLYGGQVLAAAENWPEGIKAATRFLVIWGCRIRELWNLTLADWAVHGFGCELDSPDKGSAGERVKYLFLQKRDHAALTAWVAGPRAAATGLTLAEARRLDLKTLAREPLFLGPNGRSITPGHYRDYYFRPTMRALGIDHVTTPHRLRHEKTFRGLDKIHREDLSDEEEARMVKGFATLIMGWASGTRMAEYYAPQSKLLMGRRLAERLFADEDDDLDPPPPTNCADQDVLLAAFQRNARP